MQSTRFEDGVWAVVHSGGKKYVGKIASYCLNEDAEVHQAVIATLDESDTVEIDGAFELVTMAIPVRGPQGMGLSHSVHVVPVDGCLGPAKKMFLKATAIHLFEDMQPEDVERHKNLVEQFVAQLEEAKRTASAAKAGILMAGPGSLPTPNGPGGEGGGFRPS